jgi:hypothetical protein
MNFKKDYVMTCSIICNNITLKFRFVKPLFSGRQKKTPETLRSGAGNTYKRKSENNKENIKLTSISITRLF